MFYLTDKQSLNSIDLFQNMNIVDTSEFNSIDCNKFHLNNLCLKSNNIDTTKCFDNSNIANNYKTSNNATNKKYTYDTSGRSNVLSYHIPYAPRKKIRRQQTHSIHKRFAKLLRHMRCP